MDLVSICICTHNRAECLSQTLDALAPSAAIPGIPVEIIVVNNCSTDDTECVVRLFASAHSEIDLVYVDEPRPGVSNARNAAIAASSGDPIVFIDDDVTVRGSWLHGLLCAFGLDGRVGCVAGRVAPWFGELQAPSWIDDRYYGFYGAYDRGDDTCLLPYGEPVVGCCFAIRRDVVGRVGGFDTYLGRKGDLLLSGEDDDYSSRIWESGYLVAYASDGCVYHRVHPERLTFRWLMRRYFWQGVTSACRPENRSLCYPLRALPKLICNALLLPITPITGSRRRIYHTCFRIANASGHLYRWHLLPTAGPAGAVGRGSVTSASAPSD